MYLLLCPADQIRHLEISIFNFNIPMLKERATQEIICDRQKAIAAVDFVLQKFN